MSFRRGLIVGKFSPLHRGHQLLIDEALAACDELVLLSYAKPERPGCDTARRRRWLKALYPQVPSLVVDDAWMAERAGRGLVDPFAAVPHDDEPEDLHRRFTAWLAQGVLGVTCDAVFTSEDYGDGFASVLTELFGHPVHHVCVDRARDRVPVSATAIRGDAAMRARFLAPAVNADWPLRLVFLGAESTGKTTLCTALGERWNEPVAHEYGRELWIAKDGRLELPDLLAIGDTQVAREDALLSQACQVLICDTSPLTTAFYSEALFGTVDPALERLAQRSYDITFLCRPDIPFIQDGTRQDEAFRQRQHAFYERVLGQRGIPYVSLHGALDVRIAAVEQALGQHRAAS